MPHLVFIATGRDVGMYRLTGLTQPIILGRDVEGDIYVPDVFVSRQHCRFEPLETGEWAVVDARSRNGIHYNGHRVFRRVLRHGDTIEIGSVAFQFDESDLPPTLSSQTPFGQGTKLASFVDTVFTEGLRPGDWIRRNQKKPAWVKAAEAQEAERRAKEEAVAAEARALAERLDFSEPTELDLELQLGRAGSNGDGEDAEVTPAFVLVPVELARRAYALADGSAAAPTSDAAMAGAPSVAPGDAAGAPLGDLSALASLAAPAGAVPGTGAAPAGQPAPATVGLAGAPVAAQATSYAKRTNLWAEAEAKAEPANDEGKKKKKPKAPKAAKSAGPGIGANFGDFLRDLPGRLRSMNVSELMELIAQRPIRAASVAAIVLIPLITIGIIRLSEPKYKKPPRYLKNGQPNPAYVVGSNN